MEAFIKAQRLDYTAIALEYYFSSDRISKKKLFQLFAKDIKVTSLADMYVLQDFSSLKNIELVLDEDQFIVNDGSSLGACLPRRGVRTFEYRQARRRSARCEEIDHRGWQMLPSRLGD